MNRDLGRNAPVILERHLQGEVPLRILATSDLHAHLLAWDYHAGRVSHQRGLARVSSLIAAARIEQPQSLLFDNGDFLHGSDLGDFATQAKAAGRRPKSGADHPVIAAMNHLHYDAVTLGNHEFSHGVGFLRRSLAAAKFPLVCSNLYFKPNRGAPLALPFVLLTRRLRDNSGVAHTLRIGVLGFLPPQTMIWERRYLKSCASVDDILASAKLLIPDLRRGGADLIIALSHSGISEPANGLGAENASSSLARLEGIDVVVAGHTHLIFPDGARQDLHGKPAVMPGFYGSHLGVIDLTLRKGNKGWRVVDHHSEVRPIAGRRAGDGAVAPLVQDDTAIVALAEPSHAALLARGEEVIGNSAIGLHSYFALVTESTALRLVAKAQAHWLAHALRGGPFGELPILSAVAPFKAGGRGGPENYTDIAAGPLRLRHLSDLYLHPNTLTALRVTGADLALWLERSVSLYHQIRPGGQDQPLIDERFPSFNFDSIDGLSFQIDLTQPARFDPLGNEVAPLARRIRDLRFCNRPIEVDEVFALASNSYRCAGGAGFAGAAPSAVICDDEDSNRAALEAYLRAGHVPEAVPQPSWRFLPIPATSAFFDTAPEAAAHLSEMPHLRLEARETLPNGFRRFRLHL